MPTSSFPREQRRRALRPAAALARCLGLWPGVAAYAAQAQTTLLNPSPKSFLSSVSIVKDLMLFVAEVIDSVATPLVFTESVSMTAFEAS